MKNQKIQNLKIQNQKMQNQNIVFSLSRLGFRTKYHILKNADLKIVPYILIILTS